jgi:hypothetical protein
LAILVCCCRLAGEGRVKKKPTEMPSLAVQAHEVSGEKPPMMAGVSLVVLGGIPCKQEREMKEEKQSRSPDPSACRMLTIEGLR